MKTLDWVITNSDKISAFVILIVICVALAWIAKKLYEQGRECEKARIDDLSERSKMNREIGELAGEVKTLQSLNHQALLETIRSKNGKPK